MDWKAKVELFEQLRREHEFGIGTVAGVAANLGFIGDGSLGAVGCVAACASLSAAAEAKAGKRCGVHRRYFGGGSAGTAQAAAHGAADLPAD